MAAVYHFKLCRAILVGFRRQLQKDGICKDGFIGMMEKDHEPQQLSILSFTNNHGEVLNVQNDNGEIYKDDLTGQLLDPVLVRAARAKELESTLRVKGYGDFDLLKKHANAPVSLV